VNIVPEESVYSACFDGPIIGIRGPERRCHWFRPSDDGFLLTRIDDLDGNRIDFEYSGGSRLALIVDSLGRRIAVREEDDLIASFEIMTSGSWRILARYFYNADSDLIGVEDPLGNRCHFEYVSHLITTFRNRTGGSQFANYDEDRRCLNLWCQDGTRHRSAQYDSRKKTTLAIDARGAATLYRLNPAGLVTEEVNALGMRRSFTYDDNNGLICTTGWQGRPKTTTFYNAERRVLTVIDGAGAQTLLQENELGQPVSAIDAIGRKWTWQYDKRGRLIHVTKPSSAKLAFAYDDHGFLVQKTTSLGNNISQSRSSNGREVRVWDSIGPIGLYRYSELGWLIEAEDGQGRSKAVERDMLGQVTAVVSSDGSRVEYEYDAEGNIVLFRDELAHVTRYQFDSFGRCCSITEPTGATTFIHWDEEGEPISILNGKGDLHRITYDVLGRVSGQQFFDGHTEHYEYDSEDNIVRVESGTEEWMSASYNPVGRITEKRYSDGQLETFEYDSARRATKFSRGSFSVSLVWDELGNLAKETQGTHTLLYEYDVAGNRTVLRSTEREIHYSYDTRGRLATIDDSACGRHRFGYDRSDRQTVHVTPGNVELNWSFGQRGLPLEQKATNGQRTLLHRRYSFDAAARLKVLDEVLGDRHVFDYDACDQLVGDRTNKFSRVYAYDDGGNLVHSEVLGQNPKHQAERLPAESCRFSYDASGRLSQIFQNDDEVVSYEYDAIGRRVSKTVNEERIEFLWDGFVLLSEQTAGFKTEYLIDGPTFNPLSQAQSGTAEHFVTDYRGCVIGTLNEAGQLTNTFEYEPFGSLSSRTGRVESSMPFRMKGQYADSESGLHYNLYRYYDASAGRFTTRDPLGIAAGSNLYRYGPNPISWLDPFGLESECQGDVFYRAVSTKEKDRILADCKLKAKNSKCPEGPYVSQKKEYCQSALREKPGDYQHLIEICTQPGTVTALKSSPFTGINGSQSVHWPAGMPAIASGQVDRIELKLERLGRPDEALNYGLSKGKGLDLFNSKVESMKFAPTGESCP
jgi:RHS repeat-associated protein